MSHLLRLALPVLLVLAFAAAASSAQEHKYVGVKKCRSCHKKAAIGNQFGVWEDSKHSKAFETLASEEAKKLATAAGVEDPQAAERCLKCHVTAYGAPKELLGLKFEPNLGVQCEACHGAGMDYSKKKIMIDRDLSTSKGLIIPSEETCKNCHSDQSPTWDPERYTRPDGTKVGFDFEQAFEKIAHPVPEDYDPSARGGAD
jgi:hypothetical protein